MKKLLVSLDELLDTRLGMIAKHQPEIAAYLVGEGKDLYFLRRDDSILWESLGWDKATWDKCWCERDVEVLQNSVVTHIPAAIANICAMYVESTERAIEDLVVELDVNTAPYQLTQDELSTLEDILTEMIPSVTKIRFVHLPFDRLTHSYVKNEYGFVIMYDFNKWLDIHGKAMQNVLMNQIQFFVPRLFKEKISDEEFEKEKDALAMMELDLFKLTECMASPKIGLTFIAASDFGPVLTAPIVKQTQIKDLDDRIAQSGSYIPESFLYDPQFPSHPE